MLSRMCCSQSGMVFISTRPQSRSTAKLIDFECHMTAPEIWLVLTVGLDPRGYSLGGFNLFKLANEKLFGFFHLYYIDHLLVYGKNLYVPQLLLCSIDIE